MKLLVVLNPTSPFAAMYAHNPDVLLKSANGPYLGLICSEANLDHPYYVFAKHEQKEGRSHQAVHIPHSAVVAVYRLNEGDPLPIGFA